MIVRGSKLSTEARAEVLAAYGYRWTSDNKRREDWWRGIKGQPTIPLVTDAEWLEAHAFHVTKAGRLDRRYHNALPHYMVCAQ